MLGADPSGSRDTITVRDSHPSPVARYRGRPHYRICYRFEPASGETTRGEGIRLQMRTSRSDMNKAWIELSCSKDFWLRDARVPSTFLPSTPGPADSEGLVRLDLRIV